jgi:hypothetical protein
MSAENLWNTYLKSIPVEREEAIASYDRYHLICRTIAERHGYPVEVACGVFSALSPNNEYHGNIRDLETVLVNARRGGTLDDFTVATYGNNKRKAWDIVHGQPVGEAIKARKTWAFFNNVFRPSDPEFVTVDGHMYWCWAGRAGTVKGLRGKNRTDSGLEGTPSLGAKLYEEIAGDVRGLAFALGLVPCQLQAILWVTWKRIHRRAYSNQTNFFPKDFEVAGIINFSPKDKEIHSIRKPLPLEKKDKDPAKGHPEFKFVRRLRKVPPPKYKTLAIKSCLKLKNIQS